MSQVLASSPEQLALARGEIAVMKRLQHPNLLPLLGSALVSVGTAAGGHAQVRAGRGGGDEQESCMSCTLQPRLQGICMGHLLEGGGLRGHHPLRDGTASCSPEDCLDLEPPTMGILEGTTSQHPGEPSSAGRQPGSSAHAALRGIEALSCGALLLLRKGRGGGRACDPGSTPSTRTGCLNRAQLSGDSPLQ